jgi:hypothetical protein
MTLVTPLLANATNGYFSHGYGAKSQGMAGVGIALPQDALAAATNPAGTALVGTSGRRCLHRVGTQTSLATGRAPTPATAATTPALS